MRSIEFITEGWAFRNKNRIYSLLVNTIDSGPFDGGCVVFARALQLKYDGGEIVVLVNRNNRAEHAALMIGGKLIDADGKAGPSEFISRFTKNENLPYDSIVKIRILDDDDLPDAPRDESLSRKIAELL